MGAQSRKPAADIVIAPSGLIYATGWFGWDRGALIRLHPDGQLDNTLPKLLDGTGEALHLDDDGSVHIAGFLGWTQGRFRAGLAAFEPREDHLFADGFQL